MKRVMCRLNKIFSCKLSKLLFLSFIFAQAYSANIYAAGNPQVYIQVKTTKLRQEPKQWGQAIADLNYGDALNLIEQQAAWVKVSKQDGTEGYIHQSAISGRRILVAATAETILNTSAEETDVFLAGKGFSSGVLDRYLDSASTIKPQAISTMKGKENLSDSEFKEFLIKGKLKNA